MPPAAILDVDGTLVDTNYHHAIAWYRAFRQHDVVLPIWRIHRHIGMGGDQLVEALCGERLEEEKGDDIRAAEKALYLRADRRGRAARGRARADRGPEGARARGRARQLGEAGRGRPLPRPARRPRSRGRLDDLRRRRGHEARARPRAGGGGEGGRRRGRDGRRLDLGLRGRQARGLETVAVLDRRLLGGGAARRRRGGRVRLDRRAARARSTRRRLRQARGVADRLGTLQGEARLREDA